MCAAERSQPGLGADGSEHEDVRAAWTTFERGDYRGAVRQAEALQASDEPTLRAAGRRLRVAVGPAPWLLAFYGLCFFGFCAVVLGYGD